MKQIRTSFEEKIKITFTKYARLLTIILFIILVLFIGFESVVKPKYSAYKTNKVISRTLETLNTNIEYVMDSMANITDTSDFYESYYSNLILKGISGDISIYDENKNILYITNPSDEGSTLKSTFNQYFMDNIDNAPHQKAISSINRDSDSGSYNDIVFGKKVERIDGSPIYVVVYVKSELLTSYLDAIHPNLVVITDRQNYVLASTSPSLVGRFNRFNIPQEASIILLNREYKIEETRENTAGLKVYILTNVAAFPNFLVYVSITFAVILWVHQYASSKVAERVGREASASISQLKEMIDKIAIGELGTTVELDTQDEFEELAQAFNSMSLALKHSIENNKQLMELQKTAEIKQLEAQFNPHFLYNSLETIRYLIAANPKLAEVLILRTTQLLRYSIDGQDELVPFRKDFEYIRVFLDIHKIRLDEALNIEIDIEEAIFDEALPKLILLPLIENSIKYGYKDQDTLSIKIIGRIVEDMIILTVLDDGLGMDKETLARFQDQRAARLSSASHYGLYSIHHRISLIYQNDAYMTIAPKDRGTEISITLPRRSPHV